MRGNNLPLLSHCNTKTERERGRERGRERERGRLSPQAKLTQTDNFKVKTVVYLVKGKGGKKRENLSDMQLSGEHFHMQNSE